MHFVREQKRDTFYTYKTAVSQNGPYHWSASNLNARRAIKKVADTKALLAPDLLWSFLAIFIFCADIIDSQHGRQLFTTQQIMADNGIIVLWRVAIKRAKLTTCAFIMPDCGVICECSFIKMVLIK
jgi:hypothetical protein